MRVLAFFCGLSVLVGCDPGPSSLDSGPDGAVRRDAGADAACMIECAMPPASCRWEGTSCTSCGTLVCDDAGIGCKAPLSCEPPPAGCEYVGGDGCTTCGTLVCDEVVCGVAEPRFPTFDRTCSTAADCAVVEHQVDCCGTLIAQGVARSESVAFADAEEACRAMYPGCDCAPRPTTAEDGTSSDGTRVAHAECVVGQCTATFALAAGEVCGGGSGACGPGLACCYPCGIPGCEFRCEPACDPGTPGCSSGCLLRP